MRDVDEIEIEKTGCACACSRRDVLKGVGLAGVGVMVAACDGMARDVVGDVSEGEAVDVDVSGIAVGESVTKLWKGKPVFIRHRTEEEIAAARGIDGEMARLRDPELDTERVLRSEWLVVVGVCPHLGCIPKGQTDKEPRGKYNGWFCACHGTQYDTSGRLMEGPGPGNLVVPPYHFVSDKVIRIGAYEGDRNEDQKEYEHGK